jgi:hypothetical protein
MADDMRNGVKAIVVGALLGLLAGAGGCGGGSSAATERLWVSGVPTNPKDSFSAFLTMRSDDHYLGAFFHGSFLRGSHDVFKWRDTGKGRARIELLQDGRKVELRLEPCKPTTGFDYCLDVFGDPTDAVRYQSRKRWAVRRPGKRDMAASGLFGATLLELAEDDEELAAALDAAAEAAEAPIEGVAE